MQRHRALPGRKKGRRAGSKTYAGWGAYNFAYQEPIILYFYSVTPLRIVQCKMILKHASFPIQSDPENSDLPRCQVDADSHGKRRSADAGKNRGFSGRECRDRFHGTDTYGTICVDSGDVGRTAILLATQETARRGARAAEQGRRTKPATGNAADSPVSAQ